MDRSRRWVTALAVVAIVFSASGSGGASTVPGSDDAVLTLRIGTDDEPGRSAADQIEEFARLVAEHSDGAIVVEPVWHAAGDTADWDQQVARLVTSGDLEMGLIPSRAWDTEGVTTLRALNAPFLVTTEELVNEVVAGELSGELMSGLDAAGVVGLALFPEGFRHPFALGDPLLGPDDYQGAVIRAPTSATTAATFEALGATTNDDEPDPATHAGLESSYLLGPPGTATGNVTFFPKVNSLVVNAQVWAGLTGDQQGILTSAAAATRDWAIDHIPSDHDAALERCANGSAIVLASDEDLAALVEATAPVIVELREDPATAALIDEITALRDALPPMAIEPVACDSAPVTTTATPAADDSDGFPEGVYLAESRSGEVVTHSYEDGVWRRILEDGNLDCESTYVVESGRIWLTSSADVALACGNPANLMFLDATWTLEGDQLRFTDINSDPGAVGEFSLPWTRIQGDGDSGADVSDDADFPEGVYQMEITAETLVEAGVSFGYANDIAGVWTMTFDDGQLLIVDINAITGQPHEEPGGYCVTGNRISVYILGAEVCDEDEFWSAEWTVQDGALRFTDIQQGAGVDVEAGALAALIGSHPWETID